MIYQFLTSLDAKYNCENTYTQFKATFLEKEITVNVIKDLDDEQLQRLGVAKLGWKKNIQQAVQKF